MKKINIPTPGLQIDFSFAIGELRSRFLQEALFDTLKNLDISAVDKELSVYVPKESLNTLAARGLRGELLFPVPCVLSANPSLLGYYRLLLGFSQKQFYSGHFGLSPFFTMESKGVLTSNNKDFLPVLCEALIRSAVELINGVGDKRLSKELLDDLTLLTVGPQLRGGANVRKGIAGTHDVFQVIHKIVSNSIVASSSIKIELLNAAGRKVFIEFSSDPDIVIREEGNNKFFRNIIAIEVKGGTDFSNIHNRVGEAEKSHQKARINGYVECWTVVNVDKIDLNIAKKESPSTNQFYKISSLKSGNGPEYQDFKSRIISLTGIK